MYNDWTWSCAAAIYMYCIVVYTKTPRDRSNRMSQLTLLLHRKSNLLYSNTRSPLTIWCSASPATRNTSTGPAHNCIAGPDTTWSELVMALLPRPDTSCHTRRVWFRGRVRRCAGCGGVLDGGGWEALLERRRRRCAVDLLATRLRPVPPSAGDARPHPPKGRGRLQHQRGGVVPQAAPSSRSQRRSVPPPTPRRLPSHLPPSATSPGSLLLWWFNITLK